MKRDHQCPKCDSLKIGYVMSSSRWLTLPALLVAVSAGSCNKTRVPPSPGADQPAVFKTVVLPRGKTRRSSTASPPKLKILVTRQEIWLSAPEQKARKIVKVAAGQVPPTSKRGGASGYLIKPLFVAARAARAKALKAGRASSVEVAILAEHNTPYRLLSEVLYTAGKAELSRRTCLVVSGEGGARQCIWLINTDPASPSDAPSEAPSDPPSEEELNLAAVVSYSGFIVAVAGGVMAGPDGHAPSVKCAAPLKQKRCTARLDRSGKQPRWIDDYDYPALAKLLAKVKKRYPMDRKVTLSADDEIPYQTFIRTLDTVWGAQTHICSGTNGCMFDQFTLRLGGR